MQEAYFDYRHKRGETLASFYFIWDPKPTWQVSRSETKKKVCPILLETTFSVEE